MYIPTHFREDNVEVLLAFMREYSFAALVTQQDGLPLANHFPFVVDSQPGRYGTLRAHMARANAQWRTFADTEEALVIFQGPHTYVSPSWYVDDVELSVPTWNYAAVHAYGRPRLIEDSEELYQLLKTSVQENEAHFEHPWQLQLPDTDVQKKLKAIVGFEIQITRLKGKFKLSQNRSVNDRSQVIAALQDELGPGVAELMGKRIEK
jgi:transcriptional regulator